MDLNIHYEGYSEVMRNLANSYFPINEDHAYIVGIIATELGGTSSASSVFNSFADQLYNFSILVSEYHDKLSADFNAIDAAVTEFMYYDQNTASNVSGN